MISRFFISLALIGVGVLGVRYAQAIIDNVGRIGWAERRLGSGSSYGVIKFFSILLIFFSFFFMIGLEHLILDPLLYPLRTVFKMGE